MNFFDEEHPIPDDSSLMILNVNFPFDQFMNSTADVYADDMKISSLYLYDWLDNNNDTKISSDEISQWLIEVVLGELYKKFEFQIQMKNLRGSTSWCLSSSYTIFLLVGNTNQNSTSMDYTISASYYQNEKWSMLWPESETISVPPNDISTVDVTLVTPTDLQTGAIKDF